MSLRGVFFDLYGTLLCFGDMQAAWMDWMHAFHESLVPHGLRISPAEFALQCDGFFTQPDPERRDGAFIIFEARVEALCADLGIEVPAARIPAHSRDRECGGVCVASLPPRRPGMSRRARRTAQTLQARADLELRPSALRRTAAVRPGADGLLHNHRRLGRSRREEARPPHLPYRP